MKHYKGNGIIAQRWDIFQNFHEGADYMQGILRRFHDSFGFQTGVELQQQSTVAAGFRCYSAS